MIWLVLAAVGAVVAIGVARQHRHRRLPVLESHPISVLHGARAKRQTARTKAALDAATSALR